MRLSVSLSRMSCDQRAFDVWQLKWCILMNRYTVIFTSCDTLFCYWAHSCSGAVSESHLPVSVRVFSPFFLTCIPAPCMFGDNVSALKPASLSQVLQEALISFLCNNWMNYFQRRARTLTNIQAGWVHTHTHLLNSIPLALCKSL